mgnify:CR=1 FL=1
MVNNDDFRKEFFYTEYMDEFFRTLESEVRVLFNIASGRIKTDNHGYGIKHACDCSVFSGARDHSMWFACVDL